MNITEVRIKLCDANHERLLAFCSVTFADRFVVRDLKLIDGTKGTFVAMPSRKLTDRCNGCGCKNHLRARFCNGCGGKLDEARATRDADGRAKLHADVCHPINRDAREVVQAAVVRAYEVERERAKLPGYVCTYDDFDGGDFDDAPMSYGAVVAEMGPRTTGFKPHAPHPAPAGPKGADAARPRVGRPAPAGGFGDGVL